MREFPSFPTFKPFFNGTTVEGVNNFALTFFSQKLREINVIHSNCKLQCLKVVNTARFPKNTCGH